MGNRNKRRASRVEQHRADRLEAEGERRLDAMQVKALDKVAETVETVTRAAVGESSQPRFKEPHSIFTSVYRWVLSSMQTEPSERATLRQWDTWYQYVVQQEPFLAGIFNGVVQIDVNRGWSITGGQRQVNTYTDVLKNFDRWVKVGSRYVKGNGGGWRAYSSWQSQSYWATQIGFVSEKGLNGRGGPLFTLWSVDPTRCELTGNPALPLKYYPATGGVQEWDYDKYIRKCSMISTDEKKLGYGFPAVARCYQLAKIMVGMLLHSQQKLGTKMPDGILTGKFIGQEQWNDALIARAEALKADPNSYLNSIATIMSSGGDMPEFALTLLSSMPDRWDLETVCKFIVRGYETNFGYKGEFTYENAGVLGRGNEVEVQHRNATGMGGKDYILEHQGELQELLPPTIEFLYDERDVAGEAEEAALQLAKVQVIDALSKLVINGQSVLTVPQIMSLAAEQGVIPDDWTPATEDVTSTDEEDAPEESAPAEITERVQRAIWTFPGEPIVRYSWPSGKMRVLRLRHRSVYHFPYTMKAKRVEPIAPVTVQAPQPNPISMTFNMPPVSVGAPSVNVEPHMDVTLPEMRTTVNVPEQQPPQVTLNVQPAEAPQVHVAAPNINVEPPVVNVTVPQQERQAPPVVNVTVPPQQRQEPPVITVNVPPPPAPNVTVNVPETPVKISLGNTTSVVRRDSQGRIIQIENEPDN